MPARIKLEPEAVAPAMKKITDAITIAELECEIRALNLHSIQIRYHAISRTWSISAHRSPTYAFVQAQGVQHSLTEALVELLRLAEEDRRSQP